VTGGCWEEVEPGLLRLYAFWQVRFQKCVNDSYDAWSSFLYIPHTYQYIQHIECGVWSWMQYFLLCLCSVWKHIVCCLSEHNYLYLETASCFCSLQPPFGHQYSILKEGKMHYTYIYIFTTRLHSVESQQCRVCITIWNCKMWSAVADCCRIIVGLVNMSNG
jgi:hypothetical protein